MTKREYIINELRQEPYFIESNYQVGVVADFIIADRKRIVEPLVKYKQTVQDSADRSRVNMKNLWPQTVEDEAIDETLKLAGEL